jgi:hypothetical protein
VIGGMHSRLSAQLASGLDTLACNAILPYGALPSEATPCLPAYLDATGPAPKVVVVKVDTLPLVLAILLARRTASVGARALSVHAVPSLVALVSVDALEEADSPRSRTVHSSGCRWPG